MSQLLVNLPYVGSVAHWALMARASKVRLEAYGPYQRRTFRTRQTILTTDGPLDISVPVHTGHDLKCRDVLINYDTQWARQHIYALETAYNSTPFFEFMVDELREVYEAHHELLWDFNVDMMKTVMRLAGLDIAFEETSVFGPALPGESDLRIAIEPKMASAANDLCRPVAYHQVFASPYTSRPFTPWMSMFDLLFNMGPECRDVLREMVTLTPNV